MKPLGHHLTEALRDGGLELSESQVAQLEQHWQLLLTWNERVNLTSITQPDAAAWLHYRDSLEGLAALEGGPVVDIGSGGGFPGIPLAVARPDWSFTLLEPRQKRASFLQASVARLGLRNARVLVGRAEDAPDAQYAHAVTRATFSGRAELLACLSWVRPGGSVVAYRSEAPAEGCDELRPYTLQGERRVLAVWRAAVAR